ncbi:hypothetical protein ACNKHP_06970 [Shigella boydii]
MLPHLAKRVDFISVGTNDRPIDSGRRSQQYPGGDITTVFTGMLRAWR